MSTSVIWQIPVPPKKKVSRTSNKPISVGRRLLTAGLRDIMVPDKAEEDNSQPAMISKPAPTPPRRLSLPMKRTRVDAMESEGSSPKGIRKHQFIEFLKKLPRIDTVWRNENNVGPDEVYPALSAIMFETVMIFSMLKEDDEGDRFSIRAELYSRDRVKSSLEYVCQLQVCLQNDKILSSWTDWKITPQHGIFVWLFHKWLSRPPKSVCVLKDKTELDMLDAQCGLDWRHDYSHYVWEKDVE